MRRIAVVGLLSLALLGCNRGKPPSEVTGPASKPGFTVRYNAVVALARRGSDRIKEDSAWETLQEMLDEDRQLRNFKHELPDKKQVADPGKAHATLITTLQAVAELHRRRPEMDLSDLKPAIEKLTQSRNLAVSTEAKRTQQLLTK
jgi:predicted AAA+ superfamily ATPase